MPADAAAPVIAAAAGILAGEWSILGVPRKDIASPEWFLDPVTSIKAPQAEYCFRIDHRREEVTGNVKQVWELSRMHHITVLAAAYALSGDASYAEAAADQLESWWAANPFLSGINWTSGIELGVRLIAWVWTRRLLEGWPGAAALFEGNDQALSQIWWHQRYLAAFQSRGSSSNNHVVAEAAGQLTAALAFPWFAESTRWQARAARLLERELAHNTFAGGINRELASDYHGFVAELGLVAAVEADRAGRPLDDSTWRIITRMLDAGAATLDESLRSPRQNDGDDGRGLLLAPPEANRWATLLAVGRELVGAPSWWPECPPDAASVLISAMGRRRVIGDRPQGGRGSAFVGGGSPEERARGGSGGASGSAVPVSASASAGAPASASADAPASTLRGSASAGAPVSAPAGNPASASVATPASAPAIPSVLHGRRPATRPSHFDDAGLAILRTPASDGPEIWCRCDGGPHGFLSIVAHAHADALSVELRHGGVDILADPGTYCYHGEPRWRSYFRSTIGHNTLELAGRDQSTPGGPFLWTRHATTRVLQSVTDYRDSGVAGGWRNGSDTEVLTWSAEHDGYSVLESPASHRRTVRLRRWKRLIEIVDRVESSAQHPFRLAFHVGPEVTVDLEDHTANLAWSNRSGSGATAVLELPSAATWKIHRGSDEPVLGWYSPHFGEKEPSSTLIGSGVTSAGRFELLTTLQFDS